MTSTRPDLGVAVVGFGWMGRVHARAVSRLLQHYPDAPLRPRVVAVAETATDDRTRWAVESLGVRHSSTDWADVVTREDVDVVCVTGPNHVHRDVAVAAAAAGKHLWIEKPAGRDASETREIVAAVRAAGVRTAAGFSYRNAPAVELARELVRSGRIGRVEHSSVRFASDYSAHPDAALTWRFRRALAGSGVLGDLVSHGVDLLRHLVAEPVELVADQDTFHRDRPVAAAGASHLDGAASGERRPVENEDWVCALLRLSDGSRAVLEASRTEVGDQNDYGIEVHGTKGALRWNYQRMGELEVCLDQDYQDASFATVRVGPGHGEHGAFQPGAANPMSYDDLKVVELHRLVLSIASGRDEGATVHDALAAAEVVEAIQASVRDARWVRPGAAQG